MAREQIISQSSDNQQSNKVFIMLSIALIGLIFIGLLGMGGAFYVLRNQQAQKVAVVPTFTLVPSPTSSPTLTPTYIPPTHTPTSPPTPTGTPVVNNNNNDVQIVAQQPESTVVVTSTVAIEAPITATVSIEGGAVTPTNTLVLQEPSVTPTLIPPIDIIPISGGSSLPFNNTVLSWAGIGLLLMLIIGTIRQFNSDS